MLLMLVRFKCAAKVNWSVVSPAVGMRERSISRSLLTGSQKKKLLWAMGMATHFRPFLESNLSSYNFRVKKIIFYKRKWVMLVTISDLRTSKQTCVDEISCRKFSFHYFFELWFYEESFIIFCSFIVCFDVLNKFFWWEVLLN